jgi:large subunit ribosomal protein L10
MITRESKEKVITELRASFAESNAVFLTNIIGMPSNESVQLRKDVRKLGGNIMVARNTLIASASKAEGFGTVFSDLNGSSALVFSYSDPSAIAKVVLDASKVYEFIKFRGGYLGKTQLSGREVDALASLPPRNQVLATLLATFNAPISAFARVVDAIRLKKEGLVDL